MSTFDLPASTLSPSSRPGGYLRYLAMIAIFSAAFINGTASAEAPPAPTEGQQMQDLGGGQPQKRTSRRPDLRWMKAGVRNLKQETRFLENNKNEPGVVTLDSGVQYKSYGDGTGPKPKKKDTVEAYYLGMLLDNSTFADYSRKLDKPAFIKLSKAVPGLQEALMLMPVGSHWRIYIPSSLGYGKEGAPPSVGPDETLVYDVELMGIKEKSKFKSKRKESAAAIPTP